MAISHFNGVAVSGISHFNGVAKSSVSAINGVTAGFGGGGGYSGPTYVGSGAFAGSTAALSGVDGLTLPSGIMADDILVFIVENANDGVVTVSGYTEAGSSPVSSTDTKLTVFWKRASGSESIPSTNDSGNHQNGCIYAFRGCITTGDPFDVTASGGSGSGTSMSCAGATTTVANTMVLAAFATTWDSVQATPFSSPSNGDLGDVTLRTAGTLSSSLGGGVGLVTGEKSTSGAYGATACTQGSAVNWAAWTGALKGP